MSDNHEHFTKYIGTWYEQWVLPVIPAGAPLRADRIPGSKSHLSADNLGKIPGKRVLGNWIGFDSWSTHRSVKPDLQKWAGWWTTDLPVPVCMRTMEMPVFDSDITDQNDADEIELIVRRICGNSAVRRRSDGSPKFSIFYRWTPGTPPITKRALKWYRPGPDGTEVIDGCDFLGDGQHTLTDGHHAKGATLLWPAGDLLAWQVTMPQITAEQFGRLRSAILEWIEEKGYRLKTANLGDFAKANNLDTFEIGSLCVLSPLAVNFAEPGQKDWLTRVVQAIDLDRVIGYDEFTTLLRAIAAACSGDKDYLVEVVHPWVITSQTVNHGEDCLTIEREEQGLPWLNERWVSFKTSCIGKDYVLTMAIAHGYQADMGALAAEASAQAAEIFGNGDTDINGPGATGSADSAEGGEQGSSLLRPDGDEGGGGAADFPDRPARIGGPVAPNDTHWNLVERFIAEHGREWHYVREAKAWFRYQVASGCWQQDDHLGRVVGRLARRVAAELRGGTEARAEDRARLMEQAVTTNAVVSLLRACPELTCSVNDFGVEPYLLNTPAGVYDLRTGICEDHTPEHMMKDRTACIPDLEVRVAGNYRERAPKWFDMIDHLANGRPWVEQAIRAALAYVLTGEITHNALLFIQGLPGIGKSVLLQVLYYIVGTYGLVVPSSFYSKIGDGGKRFDMASIIGKRMLFTDEVALNMTWDETRMCTMATGRTLSAEIKYGKQVEFVNTAKICIVGNHRPNFVSPDAGGLTSRMMLFEAEGEMIRDTIRDNEHLPEEIRDEEGDVILAWLLDASIEDANDRMWFKRQTGELKLAAREYSAENSIYRQWVEHLDLIVAPEMYMNTTWAWEKFAEYARNHGEQGKVKLHQFKSSMMAAYPSIRFDKDTTHFGRGNKSTCFGMGMTDPLNPAEMMPETVEMNGKKC